MRGKHYVYAGAVGLAVAAALSLSVSQADTRRAHGLPRFAVDGSWPKMPLPSAGMADNAR